MNISVIIPTYKRFHLLNKVIEGFNRQSYEPYEIIVVDDDPDESAIERQRELDADVFLTSSGSGPATARNCGAIWASGDILLFCGDDTIPDKDLLLAHALRHLNYPHPTPVQGLTLWHPEVVNEFQLYLTDVSGFQTNWRALQDDKGNWLDGGDGFCVTTNFSIPKNLFDFIDGFDERFGGAAWEDIDFGLRLLQSGHTSLFAPQAVNYHHHRYTIEQYVERQKKEGFWRVRLLLNYPEMAGQHIQPELLKLGTQADLSEELFFATQLDYVTGLGVQTLRYDRWYNLLNIGSQTGIIDGLRHFWTDEYSFLHAKHTDLIAIFFLGMSAIERGDYSYAQLCVRWALEKEKSAATFKYAQDVYTAVGDDEMADTYRRRFEAAQ